MAENEDALSYEEVSEIRRKEENSTVLSQVRPDFYASANALIKKNNEARNKLLVENPDMYDGLSSRYRNTAALIERIIYLRTNKIWRAALRNAPSGGSDIPDNMTSEEKELYGKLSETAKGQFGMVYGEKKSFVPNIENVPASIETPPTEEPDREAHVEAVPTPAEMPSEGPAKEEVPPVTDEEIEFGEPVAAKPAEEEPEAEPMDDVIIPDEEVIVRVLSDIPTFSGPERDYTLKKEDVVRLPSMMASALINRKMAVLVKTTV